MKKILFAIQWYPPKNSANVLCDDKIIQELLKTNEYEIHCLVYKLKNLPTYEEIGKIKIHRLSKGLLVDHLTLARDRKSKFAEYINRIILRAKQLITIPFYPCYEPIASLRFAKEAIKLHKKEHFDLVIAEHHGLDCLYAGHRLKKFDPCVKFISILWDPFSGKKPAKYMPQKFAENKINKSELKILGNADAIIALKSSRSYHESHSKHKVYFNKYHFLDIPGIVEKDVDNLPAQFIKDGKINIIYSGILNLPERDPEYILKLLSESSYADKINLVFLVNGNGKEKLIKMQPDFKGDMIINGYVNRTEINSIYHKADLLINIGGSNPTMVPSKIFEYMSYGKPILSMFYTDDEASKVYLESYPLGLCIDQRKPIEENIKILDEFIDNKLGKQVAFETVKELFPDNTPESYVKLIEEVLK